MKKIPLSIIIVLFYFLSSISYSQNYQTVEEVNDACAQLGFSGDEEAEIAVDKILDQIGLFRNFIIQQCPDINNAVAKNVKSSSGKVERYILYDNNFFNRINNNASSDWAAISILAHEIGHHLNGHALNNGGSSHKFELEADLFSGLALARLDASLEQAQSAINSLKYEKATSTHPSKADRLAAIKKGWNKGMGIKTTITDEEEDKDESLKLYQKGENAYVNRDFEEAFEFFKKASELGHADAYFYLAVLYSRHTDGRNQNYNKAYNYALKGYELGSIPATYQLGQFLANGTGVLKDEDEAKRLWNKDFQLKWFKKQYQKNKNPLFASIIGYMNEWGYGGAKESKDIALFWYKLASESNDLFGMHSLGRMYYYGSGVEQDAAKALFWIKKSWDMGYLEAGYTIGVFYEGWGPIESDYKEMENWHKKAANKGFTPSMMQLGEIYHTMEHPLENPTLSFKWYKKAADAGDGYAMLRVAEFYEKGYYPIEEQDLKTALFWYKKSADIGSSYGMLEMGRIYENGILIEKDLAQAFSWYKKAAEIGNSIALHRVGEMYYDGIGIKQNYERALSTWKKASYLKESESMFKIGNMYDDGIGVNKNTDTAIIWWKKAASKDMRWPSYDARKKLKELGETW